VGTDCTLFMRGRKRSPKKEILLERKERGGLIKEQHQSGGGAPRSLGIEGMNTREGGEGRKKLGKKENGSKSQKGGGGFPYFKGKFF